MERRTFCTAKLRVPADSTKKWTALKLGFLLALSGVGGEAVKTQGSRTVVSIQQDRFLINGQTTHAGTAAEGLLLNSRMVQAAFDDENSSTRGNWKYPDTGVWDPDRNTDEFIAALPTYRANGLRALTVNLQGGSPGLYKGNTQPNITTAFTADGMLKMAWVNRLDRIIAAADANGIVVIVGYFYFGQDHRLKDEAAVIRAVDTATDWLLASDYRNVLVEINNECNVSYDRAILTCGRVAELIARVQQRSGGRLLVSASPGGNIDPSDALIAASDYVLLHGNGLDATGVRDRIRRIRSRPAYQAKPKPIVCNEDSTSIANFDAAVSNRASWGYYDQGSNNYRDGFQSPPVNWTINTTRKKAFFDRVAYWTRSSSFPPPSSQTQAVTSFTLINADTNQPISGFGVLTGGQVTLNLSTLPTRNLNLRANTTPSTVGSVRFGLNGNPTYSLENAAPYAFAGDNNGDYASWNLGLASHVVTATPYSGASASGSAGTSLSLSLTIVEGATSDTTAPAVTLTYDASSGKGEVRATDASPITFVEVRLNGTRITSGGGVPFPFATGALPSGSHTLEALVTDTAGNVGRAATTVTIEGASPPSSSDLRVTHFTLINADTDQPISGFDVLTGGQVTLDLSTLPTRNLNLRANTSPSTVGSVGFGLNGNSTYNLENAAPYALAGDSGGDYAPWSLGLGSHAVTATPYSGSDAAGTAGTGLSLSLTIVKGATTSLYRVNAGGSALAGTSNWTADTTTAPSTYVNAAAAGNTTYETGAAINLNHSSLPPDLPSGLFRTERYDTPAGAEMHWKFPVTPGTYEVRLYFAEIYLTAPGKRVFDVAIENVPVLSGYDIVADVGAFTGVMKSFTVTTDASLDVQFNRVVENPKLSAIEILRR